MHAEVDQLNHHPLGQPGVRQGELDSAEPVLECADAPLGLGHVLPGRRRVAHDGRHLILHLFKLPVHQDVPHLEARSVVHLQQLGQVLG